LCIFTFVALYLKTGSEILCLSSLFPARSGRDNYYSFIHHTFLRPEEPYRPNDDPWEQRNLCKQQPRVAAIWHKRLNSGDTLSPLHGFLQRYPALKANPANKYPVQTLRSLGNL